MPAPSDMPPAEGAIKPLFRPTCYLPLARRYTYIAFEELPDENWAIAGQLLDEADRGASRTLPTSRPRRLFLRVSTPKVLEPPADNRAEGLGAQNC
jgi:hypothetical protein